VLLKHPGVTPAGTGDGEVVTTDPPPKWQSAHTSAFPVSVFVCVLALNLHGDGEWGDTTSEPWQKALFRQEGTLPVPPKSSPWQVWQKANPLATPGADFAEGPCASGFAHTVGNGSLSVKAVPWKLPPALFSPFSD
jgi:hypothetical protein